MYLYITYQNIDISESNYTTEKTITHVAETSGKNGKRQL